jgi:hypothetical protein
MLDDITSRNTLIEEFKRFRIPVHFMDYDEKFKKPKEVGGYVINLGNEQNSGTHWTALWYDGENEYYWDPYGFPPPQRVVDEVGDYYFNNTVIQDVLDGRCGLYVFMFLYHMTYGKGKTGPKYKRFLKKFSKQPRRNYNIIGEMYLSLFENTCWEGYERVPNTLPFTRGSCRRKGRM